LTRGLTSKEGNPSIGLNYSEPKWKVSDLVKDLFHSTKDNSNFCFIRLSDRIQEDECIASIIEELVGKIYISEFRLEDETPLLFKPPTHDIVMDERPCSVKNFREL
jgi:hypothetical protein